MPLPAIALLNPSCPIKPAWAVFDPCWYYATYKTYLPPGLAAEPQGLLASYFEYGCRTGHSPNFFFDEQFYLAGNPEIAALVEAGHYRSGFDHFCQYGHRRLSPHWLFDDTHYANLHLDMTLENLDLNLFHGRYDHYLQIGQHEGRSPHPLFDGDSYRDKAVAAGDGADAIAATGPYTHYLSRLHCGITELPPSIYFDPDWYIEHRLDGAPEMQSGPPRSALQHYLTCDGFAGEPVAEFSERFYRANNPDVRHGIDSGQYRNGYHHFIQLGAFELRQPSAEIDLVIYRDTHAQVRNDLNSGLVRDAFAHLRIVGNKIGLSASPLSPRPEMSEVATKQLFIRKAHANLALFARQKLDFTLSTEPAISVLMVLFEKFELTMLSLCALRSNYSGAIELIIVDNASLDESSRIGDYVDGAKVTMLTKNIGYLRACNLGLQHVTSDKILFLNNDIELGFGAIAAAIDRMRSDPQIGAVGGKIIRTHGRLQEAGSIIWKNGVVTGYMRDALALAPEVNFVRDVDFCSGVFLLCRTNVVEKLGGFDPDFSPAYYEDVDLCLRIATAGYRVVYDPRIVIHHLEYGSAADSEASMTLMQRGRKIFVRKHEAFLQQKKEHTLLNVIHARTPGAGRHVLFIEDTVPLRRLGSGYPRANDCVRAVAAAGYGVSVFPLNGAPYDIMSIYGDFPDHLEILHDRDIDSLAEFLNARHGYYDAIWISRTHNLDRILPILQQSGIDPRDTPLILDTEAVVTLRDAARAALQQASQPFDFGAKLHAEFNAAHACRHVIAVNRAEADLLRDVSMGNVSVLGTLRDPQPTPNSFSAREGMLFVASIHQPDSPNLDALHWYADAILPELALEMRQVPRLDVVGHIATDIDLRHFVNHPHIKIHGAVSDLSPFYNRSRLFVAPTRFSAGTAYKLYETASFGLPCVTTDLLVSQLGWRDGVEALTSAVGDAKKFAAQIAHLYRSEQSWAELRNNALAQITKENSSENFYADVAAILSTVIAPTK